MKSDAADLIFRRLGLCFHKEHRPHLFSASNKTSLARWRRNLHTAAPYRIKSRAHLAHRETQIVQALHSVARSVDRVNDLIGRAVAWLTLAMVLIQFAVVVLRYVFGLGFIWMQESILYMHGIVFLVGAGYTLLKDGHVRVDIFYREARPNRKALVDLLGVIFLLAPFCILVWTVALPYVQNSWAVFEGSKETSGIQGVYLLKTTILVFTVLVGLQGVAVAFKSILVLTGVLED